MLDGGHGSYGGLSVVSRKTANIYSQYFRNGYPIVSISLSTTQDLFLARPDSNPPHPAAQSPIPGIELDILVEGSTAID